MGEEINRGAGDEDSATIEKGNLTQIVKAFST